MNNLHPISQSGEKKYRPYFTASELLYLISLAKSANPPRMALITYLEEFAIKIERGIKTPAITNDPSIESKLGLVTQEDKLALSIETLVHMWEMFPSERNKLTPPQLLSISDYRYLNDRMTPQEETDYENQSMQIK